MVKKQHMRWSQRGAHLLLQIRTRVLNGEWEATFRQWYPGFRAHTTPVVACEGHPRTACAVSRCEALCPQQSDSTIRHHRLLSAGLVSVFNVATSQKPTEHVYCRIHEAVPGRHTPP